MKMRKVVAGFSIAGAMAVSAAAAPRQAASEAAGATRSVADYLCAFAGKCEAEPAGEAAADADVADAGVDPEADALAGLTKPAPETRGFSLARPTAVAPVPAARPTPPRGMQRIVTTRVAPPAAAPVRPRRIAARSRAAVVAAAPPASPRFSYAGAPPSVMAPRVDLMLTFDKNSARMTRQAQAEAAVFAQSLLAPELRTMKFTIEGHTDSAGGRAYNLKLSQRRARAVAAFLASKGVEADRLQVRGMAFDAPRPGQTPDSPDNRRVEAVLTS